MLTRFAQVFYSEIKEASARWGHLVFDFPHMALNQPTILLAFKAVTGKHTPLENWSPEDLEQLRTELVRPMNLRSYLFACLWTDRQRREREMCVLSAELHHFCSKWQRKFIILRIILKRGD
jgi:hypothetical protein